MSTELLNHANRHFEQHLNVPLARLLQPIDASHPAGQGLQGGSVYQAIQAARRQDDASVPQGAWQHELKRADWSAVCAVAADALCGKTKDLQLAAWLLEGQIHQRGFAGIAPALVLIAQLQRCFGDQLHPQDREHRADVLRWINATLPPALKQLPLTATGQGGEFGWVHRDMAARNEQHKPSDPGAGPTLHELQAAEKRTPTGHYLELRTQLRLAVEASALLAEVVDECFAEDPPSLGAFFELLEQMLAYVDAELRRRELDPTKPGAG